MRKLCMLVALALLVCVPGAAEFEGYDIARYAREELAEGVTREAYELISREQPGVRQILHVVYIASLDNYELVAYANERGITGLSTVREKGARVSGALAGVNGDFFDVTSGGCCGWLMTDGVWRATSEYGAFTGLGRESWALMIDDASRASVVSPDISIYAMINGARVPVNAVNQLCATDDVYARSSGGDGGVAAARLDNELTLYTPDWGARTPGFSSEALLYAGEAALTAGTISAQVVSVSQFGGFELKKGYMALCAAGAALEYIEPLSKGDIIELELSQDPALAGAYTIIGGGRHDGGPLLVMNGEIAPDVPEDIQNLFYAPKWYQRHARTAVGVDADGGVFFAVCQGYQTDGASGATIAELKRFMLDLGAREALNLDGGSSSLMVAADAKGRLRAVSSPGAGREIPVGNAIFIRRRQ